MKNDADFSLKKNSNQPMGSTSASEAREMTWKKGLHR